MAENARMCNMHLMSITLDEIIIYSYQAYVNKKLNRFYMISICGYMLNLWNKYIDNVSGFSYHLSRGK